MATTAIGTDLGDDETGSWVAVSGITGGKFVLTCTGTFDSASCAVEYSPDGTLAGGAVTDSAGTALAFTAAGNRLIDIGPGPGYLRGVTSGGSGSAAVDVDIWHP